jgi:gamma-glutamyl:cysteine ligase YbdK (ATP-grasp superfamily)
MPNELTQTLVNAVLLLVVAFVGGTLGLRRFEALERSIAGLRAESKSDTGELRTELNTVVAGLRSEIGGLRTELKADIADLRTDLKTDIAEVQTELKADIAELRTDLKADIAELRGEQAQMRSDLTIVALAVGARPARGTT